MELQQQPTTVENPHVRKITFGDMADPFVQQLVVSMIKGAMPAHVIPDHAWLAKLSAGETEAFWILNEAGEHAGVITFECGYMPEIDKRGMYIVSATIGAPMTDTAWRKLFGIGCILAGERGCQVLQFDTTPGHARVLNIGEMLEGEKSAVRLLDGGAGVRFTVEV